MTDRNSTSATSSNPFFDAWFSNSEQLMRAQANWFSNVAETAQSPDVSEVVGLAKQNWDQCEAQFNSWVTASDQWFPPGMKPSHEKTAGSAGESAHAFEKLKLMLNPATFLSSGIDELNQVFQRLADGPDFADIGVLEKKFMRTGQDWSNLCNANAEYQTVIATAWGQAFDRFLKEEADEPQVESIDLDRMMQRWLKVANESLIQAQRSDEFLAAQRKLFKTNTQYKLKQREIIEAWCEAYTMPTRSEVDDLHLMVYQLRRELRQLKKQVHSSKNQAQAPQPNSEAPESGKQASPLKAQVQTATVITSTPDNQGQEPAASSPQKASAVKKQPSKEHAATVKKAVNVDTTNNRKPL
jgi:polyhydroxyalkanoate synthesis regulator phasin